jgi:hypothetical protein
MFNFIVKLILSVTLGFPTARFSYGRHQPDLLAGIGQGNAQLNSAYLPITMNTSNFGPNYYVDSFSGSDANPGTTPDLPWQSLEKVQDTRFGPGSVIHFKRGSTWTGSLLIRDSGQPGIPITFTAYGRGQQPVLRNPGDANTRTKEVVIDADWIVVENFLIQDVFMAGIQVLKDSEHDVIRSNEVTQTGFGIVLEGQNNLVTDNYIHDLHIVNNTPGGNDDYGAVCVSVENSYNEISYNRLINCLAPSYDFGTDGGAIEWWSTANGVYVHHNWATGNDGFLEVGGVSALNAVVAYNVSINNGRFAAFHLADAYGCNIKNFRIENNTIVEIPTQRKGWDVFWFSDPPLTNTVILRNNILYVDWFSTVANQPGFTHSNNQYYLSNGTVLNFELGAGEFIADPVFVDLANQNFKLQASSPAIDAGLFLDYSRDYENDPVPVNAVPDLGAYEYQGIYKFSHWTFYSYSCYSTSDCLGLRR